MEDNVGRIQEKAQELFALLGFSETPVVSQSERVYNVRFEVDEPNYLIGRQGETLDALQHVLRLFISREIDLADRLVIIDVNGYREKRTKNLEKKARESAHLVRENGKEIEIPFLNSFERRIVHSIVSTVADVESVSEGDGYERKIIIKKKK